MTNLQIYLMAGVPTVAVILVHIVWSICLRRALRQINARFDSLEHRMDSMFEGSSFR